MATPQQRKGSTFELAVQAHHVTHGFPHCEKTRAGYERDHGDLHPCGDRTVVAQCKNVRRWDLAAWLRQLTDQIANAGAEHGYLVVKRPRIADPGQAYVITTLDQHLALLHAAGYGDPREPHADQPTDGAA